MTDQSSPITPTPAMVRQWFKQADESADPDTLFSYCDFIATAAAQWGADQELEACCEWLAIHFAGLEKILRAARRPKPATLNSIALQMLGTIERDAHYLPEITDTIRKALEALPND